MEAITDKPISNKNFKLRAAFGAMLTEHRDPIQASVHRYLYRFPENLLSEFRQLCAERNITILRELKKDFINFEFRILEDN